MWLSNEVIMSLDRVILAIATVMIFLGLVTIGVWGSIIGQPIIIVTCFALAVVFGIFIRNDYKTFFGNKNGPPPPAAK
jgi:fatty acid desaturase